MTYWKQRRRIKLISITQLLEVSLAKGMIKQIDSFTDINNVISRCGNNDECYWDEFKYVYNYYNYSKVYMSIRAIDFNINNS